VIAIIGILSAILIPTVGRVRESARNSQCSASLRQITLALFVYAGEHKGFLPAGTIKKETSGLTADQQWSKQIRDYLPQRGTSLTAQDNPVFVCPDSEYSKPLSDVSRSYTATTAISGPSPSGIYGRDATIPRPLNSIEERPRTPLVFDGKEVATSGASQSVVNWTTAVADIAQSNPDNSAFLDFRHGDRINMSFADGSVRSQSLADTREYTQVIWEGRL
jgi:prepilin-type processing-associated H-X9-DG protein